MEQEEDFENKQPKKRLETLSVQAPVINSVDGIPPNHSGKSCPDWPKVVYKM